MEFGLTSTAISPKQSTMHEVLSLGSIIKFVSFSDHIYVTSRISWSGMQISNLRQPENQTLLQCSEKEIKLPGGIYMFLNH